MSGAGGDIAPLDNAQRIDKWLWFARLSKSRTLAAALASSGRIRLERPGAGIQRVTRPSTAVHRGDVLIFPLGRQVRIVRVCKPGLRRGPPLEAQALYDDLTPPSSLAPEAGSAGPIRGPRPSKKERREADRLRTREG